MPEKKTSEKKTSDVLTRIMDGKRDEVAAAKSRVSASQMRERASDAPPVRPFAEALRRHPPSLIAEIKKASPSRGVIREDFDPAALARACETGGAACLSVLTDAESFQGSPDHLTQARENCTLPVLRKDFLHDPWQVAESRAMGADCILIILAAVSDGEAQALRDEAAYWKMDVLPEVHNEREMERALHLETPMVGINNRDLHDFQTRLETTETLSRLAAGRFLVSESGIGTFSDITRLSTCGAEGFLVGESLMRQTDVAAAVGGILGKAS